MIGVVKNVKQLTLLVYLIEVDAPIQFYPGQFISIVLPRTKELRPYSIATKKGTRIELCVKRVGDASTYLCSLKSGDKLEIAGPFGKLKLAQEPADSVFISVGIGISPFRAMIPQAIATNKNVLLLAGYRKESDVLFHDEFLYEEEIHNNFKYVICISQPEADKFQKGHVQDLLFQIPTNFKGNYYLCGGKQMIDDLKDLLVAKGVTKERIITERFS